MVQSFLFQNKIFTPSVVPKGIKLKRDIHELIKNPKRKIEEKEFPRLIYNKKKTHDRTRFVRGPAKAVKPTNFLLISPEIITAPGITILTGKNIESTRFCARVHEKERQK
jgi:hypothetical protein